MKRHDLVGRRFGRLVVLEYDGNDKFGQSRWRCQCDCGNVKTVLSGTILRGSGQSCGCLQRELQSKRRTTHGQSSRIKGETPEFATWIRMLDRCGNQNNSKAWKSYGGRGIKVCERWLNSFKNFLADMGPRPSANHSIDRIDNDGDYCPENCRWATRRQQANNKTNNFIIEHNGKRQSLAMWCHETGLSDGTIRGRINLGWSMDDVLGRPQRKVTKWGKKSRSIAT